MMLAESAPTLTDGELAGIVRADLGGAGVMFSERDGEAFESLTGANSITALVGSEGGWADEEIDAARARKFHIVTLGGRILRAETAAIAVTVLMQHRFGDLK